MRILHLDSGREMRGGQWQALRLHRGLVQAGHESMLLAREGSPLQAAAVRWSLPCETLKPLRVGLQSRQFDLVHAHDAHSHTVAALFARPPLIVSRRVAFPVKQGPVSRWKYRVPALFLAVSKFVAARLREADIPEEKIAVVYDGVPLPVKASQVPVKASQAPVKASQKNLLLIPYTSDPEKGMALAAEAAARAGVPFEYSRDLEADLPHARALVYLTQSEGLGSGILLAMAHGVTVVASREGGIPELIQSGVNGLLTPNEPDAVTAAIKEAFSESSRHFGAAARQSVEERFTEEQMVQSTLAAYSRVLHA